MSAADKLHNGTATLEDLRRFGDDLWGRFNPAAGQQGQRWYYRRLTEVFERRGADPVLTGRLRDVVDELDAVILARHPELTEADLQAELDEAVAREGEALQVHDDAG